MLCRRESYALSRRCLLLVLPAICVACAFPGRIASEKALGHAAGSGRAFAAAIDHHDQRRVAIAADRIVATNSTSRSSTLRGPSAVKIKMRRIV